MRVAVLYDIHGNLPALEAVLHDVDRLGVDRLVIGGDVVPGPMPRESLARLLDLERPVQFIQGNGEAAALEERAGRPASGVPEQFREVVRWSGRQLTDDQARLAAAWPPTLALEHDGHRVLFCHATPRSQTELFTRETTEDKLRPVFDAAGAPLVVCGHTHMQFDRRVGATRVINAGSVGMPFGAPGAYWLLLAPEPELRHTAYDLTVAANLIRTTRYPQANQFAARNVLQPPSEAEMLALYGRAELTP